MQDDILIKKKTGDTLPCSHCGTVLNVAGFKALDPIYCPECENHMVVPARLGPYEMYRFLGEGAMGRVYQARDIHLERDVAIKILVEDLTSRPKMWTLLEKEAKAAAGIGHNNVIQIYNMGKVLGRPYIVMELADSASLDEWLRKGPLSEEDAVRFAIDVLGGLQAAARIGLLHGDIKPANITITGKGVAKIADFGLARFMEKGAKVERWGTPYYMAPEKAREIQEDFRSDLYSLGATLFHLTAGVAPFEGKTGDEVIEKALKTPTPRLRDLTNRVSKEFSEIVYKMMRRDPEERFGSYEAALVCFRRLRDGQYRRGDCRRIEGGDKSLPRRILSGLSGLVVDENE